MRTLFLSFIFFTGLWGNPTGPLVVAGEAKFEGSECLKIEAADRTIIHWSDFSISQGETVKFIQPSSEAAVLNRVVDALPSRLLGQMSGNGRVVLVNPNGILVGKQGQIDTASFVASTLDVHNQSFLDNGELACREISWGMVVNEGEIRGSEVILMGFEVQNNGTIQGGQVDLIGAKEVWLKGSPFSIRTKCSPEESQKLREMIEADGNVYAAAFKHPEDCDWPVLQILDGTEAMNLPGPAAIVKGTVSGQELNVFGDYVDVRKEALLKGGTILLGGKNETMKSARLTKVEGTVQGDKVTVWGDGGVVFYGLISAQTIEMDTPGYFVSQGKISE